MVRQVLATGKAIDSAYHQPQGVARSERDQILAALAATGQNRRAAARLLGISRGTLYNKSRRLGIDLSSLGQTGGDGLPD
jgi:transcriptional regulator of acetoin/glycerol metabolism